MKKNYEDYRKRNILQYLLTVSIFLPFDVYKGNVALDKTNHIDNVKQNVSQINFFWD